MSLVDLSKLNHYMQRIPIIPICDCKWQSPNFPAIKQCSRQTNQKLNIRRNSYQKVNYADCIPQLVNSTNSLTTKVTSVSDIRQAHILLHFKRFLRHYFTCLSMITTVTKLLISFPREAMSFYNSKPTHILLFCRNVRSFPPQHSPHWY